MKRISRIIAITLSAVMFLTSCAPQKSAPQETPAALPETTAAEVTSSAETPEAIEVYELETPEETIAAIQLPAETAETITSAEGSSMRLVKTEGTVALSDEAGASLPVNENMRLFSGNSVATEISSLAGISLDEVKAATVGESSLAKIHQSGKKLSLDLEDGAMYFSVAKPLDADESFEIHTSTMTLGIRGTSGFVSASGDDKSVIVLASGHAVITSAADGSTQEIDHGQKVTVSVTPEATVFEVEQVSPGDYPSLLLHELSLDAEMYQEVSDQNGDSFTDMTAAMNRYREILSQADQYDYGTSGETPTGRYWYAFEQIDQSSPVPALLLAQERDYMQFIRVFQYDVSGGTVIAPGEILETGVAQIGGFRGGLQRMVDGSGLRSIAVSGGTGATDIYRISLENGRLNTASAWSGRMDEEIPQELAGEEISWYLVTEESGEQVPVSTAEENLPTDGDRTVLVGTLRTYTYEEMAALQSVPQEYLLEDAYGTHMRVLVLDEPQELTVLNSDEELQTMEASMIDIFRGELDSYTDETRMIFSIDPMLTYWPSDISLPLGQPGTYDIHVISILSEGEPAASGVLSDEMIAQIKENLGVPALLMTENRIEDPYYWEAGDRWLVNCGFYLDGYLIAGASVDRDTGELVRDIQVYPAG